MSTKQQEARANKGHEQDATKRRHKEKDADHADYSTRVSGIASAIVIKNADLFFLSDREGRVPAKGNHGLGLYYHDCRFLNAYEFLLAGVRPSPLIGTEENGFQADLVLTNSDFSMADGTTVSKESIGIRWKRVIDGGRGALYDQISFENYALRPVDFSIALSFGAQFEDIFMVRGMAAKDRGKLHPPQLKNGGLSFVYEGTDGLSRSLSVYFSPAATRVEGTTVHFAIALQGRQIKQLDVTLVVAESSRLEDVQAKQCAEINPHEVAASLEQSCTAWLNDQTRIQSDSQLINEVMSRSLIDLRILRSSLKDYTYFAAGIPWYVTLFGRDSLISTLQTLAFEPEVAEHTLRLLASFQGTRVNKWRDEEPGKIPHELRVGELARDNAIPQTPYYGTIDATPLFLILVCRHASWSGSLTLFTDLRGHVEKALDWMANYGDPQGEGYLAYECKSKNGLANQGWKDSGDAIVNADGTLGKPPIALVEVQGYVYQAKTGLADLFQRAGDEDRARQLRKEANELRECFNRDFWLEDKGIYALALEAGKKPAAVVASNAGQALWSGIADTSKARQTMERLMADDMFDGWGIRTLSSLEKRYNPVSYQLGSVWPHDNSIIAAGFCRYDFGDAACRIFTGIVEAAKYFRLYRLPEVFSGFSRSDIPIPVHYPVACHPQAWAAGAVPYMIQSLLGLVPEAFDQRLRIVHPVLPDQVNWLEVKGLRVGTARVDLRFERSSEDRVQVKVHKVLGQLDVEVEAREPKNNKASLSRG